MTLRKEFIDRIKQEEGFSAQSYWDDAPGGGGGQWTWGYGTKAIGEGYSITPEQAEVELRKELYIATADYRHVFPSDPPGLTQARYESLIDMIFNLGLTRFLGFRYTISTIKEGEWIRAAAHAQQSLWYRQVGARARRIVAEFQTGYENGTEPVPSPVAEEGKSSEEENPDKRKGGWLCGLLGKFWQL